MAFGERGISSPFQFSEEVVSYHDNNNKRIAISISFLLYGR